ncbi:MAG: hypothetical protein Q8R55_02305 [Candidatus Taylorbacteria bacterium]|nr:hypothetical protein [Candidatus Taylorbacteria bacterium]
MSLKKSLLLAFPVFIIFLGGVYFWFFEPVRNGSPIGRLYLSTDSSVDSSSTPVGVGNLLVFDFKINEISMSLNRAIRASNLKLPPVKFFDKDLSYKTSRSWFYVDENVLIIFLYSDISSKLTKEEVLAYGVHEIGHIVLGHNNNSPLANTRDVKEEKDADMFVVQSGISADVLISAINKLSPENEKFERIEFIKDIQP